MSLIGKIRFWFHSQCYPYKDQWFQSVPDSKRTNRFAPFSPQIWRLEWTCQDWAIYRWWRSSNHHYPSSELKDWKARSLSLSWQPSPLQWWWFCLGSSFLDLSMAFASIDLLLLRPHGEWIPMIQWSHGPSDSLINRYHCHILLPCICHSTRNGIQSKPFGPIQG